MFGAFVKFLCNFFFIYFSINSLLFSPEGQKNDLTAFVCPENRIIKALFEKNRWLFFQEQFDNGFYLDDSSNWKTLNLAIKGLSSFEKESFSYLSSTIFNLISGGVFLPKSILAEISSHLVCSNLSYLEKYCPSGSLQENVELIFQEQMFLKNIKTDVEYQKKAHVFVATKCLDIISPVLKKINPGLFLFEAELIGEQKCFYNNLAIIFANKFSHLGLLSLSVFDISWYLLRCPEVKKFLENETNFNTILDWISATTNLFYLFRYYDRIIFQEQEITPSEEKKFNEILLLSIMKEVNLYYKIVSGREFVENNIFYLNDCKDWIKNLFDKMFEQHGALKQKFFDFVINGSKIIPLNNREKILELLKKYHNAEGLTFTTNFFENVHAKVKKDSKVNQVNALLKLIKDPRRGKHLRNSLLDFSLIERFLSHNPKNNSSVFLRKRQLDIRKN